MSLLRGGPRAATPLEKWTVRLGVGLAAFGVVFIGWAMADIDGDGLASIDEMRYGTNPLNGDTDGDGAADGWEVKRSGSHSAAEDGLLPCGILEACPDLEPGEQPPAPKVSSEAATGMTVGLAILAAVAGIVAGMWAAKRLQ